ncbi:hypothetical protein ENUP19_0298G0019 [Entamoeba nuttalli]|uniref:Leucine-rich repeat containing protein n=2 Tax=Entamoeba nuttalli TaxID=412467 RepID=K2GHU3_ENTNP|nr:leucine-rich repeat containing protein [Entamoeba nuttalli P19]EKE42306.1 leucine-rich repeat containing protein [Entamoeba nuttalli P19]|eukprot:XP_008855351.1 leucine-rich repeat containing protein [Entamoeba nuttalli P19]
MEEVKNEITKIKQQIDQGKFIQLTPAVVMLINGLSHPEFSFCDMKEMAAPIKCLIITQEEDGEDEQMKKENNDILLLEFCKYCQLESLKIQNIGGCVDLTKDYIYKNLKTLHLDNIILQSISLLMNIPTAKWENLEEFSLTNCGLTELEDIFNEVVFPNLRVLDVSNNKIEKINNITERPLDAFIADNNQITSVYISNPLSISVLSFDNNQLMDINIFKKCFNLRELSCANNRILDLSNVQYVFRKMFNIKSIILDGNDICNIDDYRVEICKNLPPFMFEEDEDDFGTPQISLNVSLDGQPFTQDEIYSAKDQLPKEDTNEEQKFDEMEEEKNEDDQNSVSISSATAVTSVINQKLGAMYQSTSMDYSKTIDKSSTEITVLDKLLSLDVNSDKDELSLSFDAKLDAFTYTSTPERTGDDSRSIKRLEMEKHTERMETIEYVKNIVDTIINPNKHDLRDVNNAERIIKKIKNLLCKCDNANDPDVARVMKETPMPKDGILPGDRIKAVTNRVTIDVDELVEMPYADFDNILSLFNTENFVEVALQSDKRKLKWEVILPFEIPYGFELLTKLIKMYTENNQPPLRSDMEIDYNKFNAIAPKYFDGVKQDERHLVSGDGLIDPIASEINTRIFNIITYHQVPIIDEPIPDSSELIRRGTTTTTSKKLGSSFSGRLFK